MAVDSTNEADELSSRLLQATRARIVQVLEEKGMSIVDLAAASGISEGGFHSRFREGSIQYRVLGSFARALGVPLGYLLPDEERGEVLKKAPGNRPYVEDRLEAVEREVRTLRNQLRNQTNK